PLSPHSPPAEMTDKRLEPFVNAWNWAFGNNGPRYRHTCFVYSPITPSTSRNPFIARISKSGRTQGGSIGQGWRRWRKISEVKFLMAKETGWLEFSDIFANIARELRDNKINADSVVDVVQQRLAAFELSQEAPSHSRVPSEIYIVTFENEFLDELFHPDDIGGSCRI
ncbi:MAG: hypothetical protein Q9198_011143, partial [Flavoplaca austrocitrina]